MLNSTLLNLIDRSWDEYKRFQKNSWLVQPSQPILWFGDIKEYNNSNIKIVTVGLNPSLIEFPLENPELRFKMGQNDNPDFYVQSLNEYFYENNNPYMKWFSSYENLLNGLDASYTSSYSNSALHTDLGSVLATNPTWSGLSKSIKRDLSEFGIQIWHDLICYLNPDIIIVSVAREWMNKIKFNKNANEEIIIKFDKTEAGLPRKKIVEITGSCIKLNNKNSLLVYAPAAQKPIDMISHNQKKIAGRMMVQFWQEKI